MIVHTSLYLNVPSDTCHATFSGGVPACVSCLRRPDPYSSKQQTNKIKLRWALFVTYAIIQSIMRSEMCSLHLTHPSGAVGSRLCSARGAVGGLVPCSRVSPQSWTLPAGAGTLTGVTSTPRRPQPCAFWAWTPSSITRVNQIVTITFKSATIQYMV